MEKKGLENLPLFGEKIAPKTKNQPREMQKKAIQTDKSNFPMKRQIKNPIQKATSFAEYEANKKTPNLAKENVEQKKPVPAAKENTEQKKAAPAQANQKPHQTRRPAKQNASEPKVVRKTPLKIIPLGGLNEIGKNLTVFECANDIFIVDCGLAFPDSELLGVDIVIPDFTYLEKNKDKIVFNKLYL